MSNRFCVRWAVVCTVASLFSACGGSGGGGGESSTASAPPATPLALNQANADASAGEAFRVSYNGTDASSVGPVTVRVLDADSAAPSTKPDSGILLRLVFDALKRKSELKAQEIALPSGRISPLVTQTDTVACTGGGERTSVLTYSSTTLVLPGDIVSVTYTDCEFDNTLLTGRFTVNVNSVSGYVSKGVYPWSANLATSYDDLRAVAADTGNGVSVTGSMSVSAQFINGTDFTTSISSSSFSLSRISNFGVASVAQVANFNSTYEFTTAQFGLTTNATVARDLSVGRRSFSMATPLKFTGIPNAFPSSGQAILSGANGSKVRVTAVDTTNARIEVDADGDGVYETSNLRTWASFYPMSLS